MDEPTGPRPIGPDDEETRETWKTFDGWPVGEDGSRAASWVPPSSSGAAASGGEGEGEGGDGAARRFGEYDLIRVLGRGGMGVVHEARHRGLNRLVALKMIRSGTWADAMEIQRFRVEAEALARLDHPRIVPVYEVGEAEGQGFLAMKLVSGGSLADRLDRYRDDPRAAAELTAEIADAVHHAHSRGILHRDLKPANILLDADGMPLVTDFGLAKRFEDESTMTASGAVVGTPAYMSPEQAAGRRGSITTAADVYGLGTVLYSMLAGRPPIVGEDMMDTLEAVRTRQPTPPSRHNPAVPRDLETIVLKCLEKEPRRRYDSARALADDLRAWLNSRPIAARRVGVPERAWLWCRRRPAVAGLAAAVVLAAVGGTAAVVVVQANSNARLRAANQRERRQFDLAMDAVRGLRRQVADDPLLKDPRFSSLRTGLLREAAEFYGRLEEMLKGRDDPASLAALAGAYYDLGDLEEQTGSKADALVMQEKALAIRRASTAPEGDDRRGVLDLSRSLTATARLRAAIGDAGGSMTMLREAAGLASGAPGWPALEARAEALEEIARLGVPVGQVEEARLAYDQAIEIRERAVEAAPDEIEPRERLAALVTSRGEFEMLTHHSAEAAASFDRAEAILEELARLSPDDVGFLTARAGVMIKRGAMISQFLGRPRESLPEFEESRRLLADLLAEQPALVSPRLMLSDCDSWRFLAAWNLGRMNEAMAAVDDLADSARHLMRIDPRANANRSLDANALTGRALVLSRTGRHAEALPLFELAAREFEEVARTSPSIPLHRFENVSALVNLANELRVLGRAREALPICERAVAISEEFVRDRENLTLVQMHLGEALRQLAEVQWACGDPAGAGANARRAIEILSDPPPAVAQSCYERAAARAVLSGLAETPRSGVAPAEGPPAAVGAIADLSRLADLGYRNALVVRGESAFSPLRDRDDFRAVMTRIDSPDDPPTTLPADVFAPATPRGNP